MDSRVQVFRPDSVLVSGDDDGASHALAETMVIRSRTLVVARFY
jgi:hypothetical protein